MPVETLSNTNNGNLYQIHFKKFFLSSIYGFKILYPLDKYVWIILNLGYLLI